MHKRLFNLRKQNLSAALDLVGKLVEDELQVNPLALEGSAHRTFNGLRGQVSVGLFGVRLRVTNVRLLIRNKYRHCKGSVVEFSKKLSYITKWSELRMLERGLDVLIRHWPIAYAEINGLPHRKGDKLYLMLLRTYAEKDRAVQQRLKRQVEFGRRDG